MPSRLSVIVCAHNEASTLDACLHALRAQTRLPDEIIVVDNASTDRTALVALSMPGVTVVREPRKGLPFARAAGQRVASGDILLYLDADCRAPLRWIERMEARFRRTPFVLAVTGPCRFYDWSRTGAGMLRAYDLVVAPVVHGVARACGLGAVLYGGNFAVRRDALERIGGFDTRIAFHGEDTNLGRRLGAIGPVHLARECYLYTSARRYRALGGLAVCRLYVRNFLSELLRRRPCDTTYVDVRVTPSPQPR